MYAARMIRANNVFRRGLEQTHFAFSRPASASVAACFTKQRRRFGAKKALSYEDLPQPVRDSEYAVRGEIVLRSQEPPVTRGLGILR
jgi:hypothetical protein